VKGGTKRRREENQLLFERRRKRERRKETDKLVGLDVLLLDLGPLSSKSELRSLELKVGVLSTKEKEEELVSSCRERSVEEEKRKLTLRASRGRRLQSRKL